MLSIRKAILSKKKLHLLPEKSIEETLKDFNIQENTNMNNTFQGLIAVNNEDIINTGNTGIKLKPSIKEVTIYSTDTQDILSKLFPQKVIVDIQCMYTPAIILDMQS